MYRRSSSMAALTTPAVGRKTAVIHSATSSINSSSKKPVPVVRGCIPSASKKRPTGIPLAVGRSSTQFGRGSIGGSGRVADKRKINDPDIQADYRKQLREFLENGERKYPYEISEKQLKQPSTEDFKRIFEFMYKYLVDTSNYSLDKCGKRMEEEVPAVFKQLGYPFEIKRSSLQAVGHSWPTMLSHLIWLKDVMLYALNLNIDRILFAKDIEDFDTDGGESEDILRKVLYEFHTDCYAMFREGNSDYCAQLQNLRDRIDGGLASNIRELEQRNANLHDELREWQKKQPEDEVLLEKHVKMTHDKEKLEAYIRKMLAFNEAQSKALSDLRDAKEAKVVQIAELKEGILKKKEILSKQSVSQADVHRLKFNKQQLEQEVGTLTGMVEARRKELWDKQIDNSQTADKMKKQWCEFVLNFKELATQVLKTDHESLPVKLDQYSPCTASFPDDCEVIKKYLLRGKKLINDEAHEVENQNLQLRQAKTQLDDQLSYISHETEDTKRQSEKLEHQLKDMKQEDEQELQTLKQKNEKLYQDCCELRRVQEMSCSEKTHERERLLKQKQELDQRIEREQAEMKESATAFQQETRRFHQFKRQTKAQIDAVVSKCVGAACENAVRRSVDGH